MSDRLNLCDFADVHILQEIILFLYDVEINGLKIPELSVRTTSCGKVCET